MRLRGLSLSTSRAACFKVNNVFPFLSLSFSVMVGSCYCYRGREGGGKVEQVYILTYLGRRYSLVILVCEVCSPLLMLLLLLLLW